MGNLYASEPAYGRSRLFVEGGKKLFCCITILLLVVFSDIFRYIEKLEASTKPQVVCSVETEHATAPPQVSLRYLFIVGRQVPYGEDQNHGPAFRQALFPTTIPAAESRAHCELESHREVTEDSTEVELREL